MSAPSAPRGAELDALAGELRRAFAAALAGADVRALVADALPPLPPKRATVRVVAIGKAALPMMQGALERWPDRIERGLVITVDGAAAGGIADERVRVVTASHPYPDERSAGAAEAALDVARGLTEADLALVLVSGGASSLASLPPEGVTIDDKRALVRDLLTSGASIREVNLVRRHFSRIKGGRLALAAAPARVLTLAVSDVIGGGIHEIGSGPSVPDPTTNDDALAVVGRFAPRWAGARLSESWKPNALPRWRARMIAGPSWFAERLAVELRRASLAVRVLPGEEGDAAMVAERRARQARSLGPGEALVIPCEPTVRLPPEAGRGGRAGWVALRALADLPDDVALLCAATDGVDGVSGSAGAVVCARDRERGSRDEVERALAAFDDAEVHARLGTHIEGRPSGANFTDVHVVARLPG